MIEGNFNILFVDDDKDDCLFFKDALDELPIYSNLTTVYDGDQMMHLLRSKDIFPSVIFLDLNMPCKYGLDCLTEIKNNAEFEFNKINEIPILLFSTSNDKELINQMYTKNATYYIQNPNVFRDLKKIIHHALNLTVLFLPASNAVGIHQPPKEDFVLSH